MHVADMAFKEIDEIELAVSKNYGKDNESTIAKRKEVSKAMHARNVDQPRNLAKSVTVE